MPSFGKKLGDPDARQLIAYLRTLNADTVSNAPSKKPFTVADGATILVQEDKQPTTAALLEMPARRFLRLVGEKMEDDSVSPLHA